MAVVELAPGFIERMCHDTNQEIWCCVVELVCPKGMTIKKTSRRIKAERRQDSLEPVTVILDELSNVAKEANIKSLNLVGISFSEDGPIEGLVDFYY